MIYQTINVSLTNSVAYILLFFIGVVGTNTAFANQLAIQTYDTKKKPLSNVVAYAIPRDKALLATLRAKYAKNPQLVAIEQRNKVFEPYISVFQTGTKVRFVNNDNVKHHIYSFSQAKTFEIPLHSGEPLKPLVFNEAGIVTLGCNIHDWMMAYALVVDTPFYAMSNAQGLLTLNNLPQGQYDLMLWHPQQKAFRTRPKIITIPSKNKTLTFNIALKSNWRKKHQKHPDYN